VTALRGDTVNPPGLGMSRVMSEDAVRRAFQDEPAAPLAVWQQRHLRRSVEPALTDGVQPSLLSVAADEPYEYVLLVTNTAWAIAGLARLYRERADSENTIDELKRQWGWGGFVTRDLLRCQVAARNMALIYNWWSLFVRCVEPQRPREAVTSRPLLLSAIGREVRHAGQTTVVLTSTHAEAGRVQRLLTDVSLFLSGLRNSAEQLSARQCWERIWERILTPFRVLGATSRVWFGQLARLPG